MGLSRPVMGLLFYRVYVNPIGTHDSRFDKNGYVEDDLRIYCG
jgi:hypothetical protein